MSIAAFATPCFRAAAGAGRSWEPARSGEWVGRFLGRIHAVGRAARFHERARLSVEDLGRKARDFVLDGDWMPDYLADQVRRCDRRAAAKRSRRARRAGAAPRLGRILGDCHRGNILWTDLGPHFVDLDDCLTGPAIQDLWMLLAGGQQEMRTELRDLLKGYEQFLPFDRGEIALDRAVARAAHDPLFGLAGAPLARPGLSSSFPWFAEPRYWEEHYRALEEQLTAVLEPPLEL